METMERAGGKPLVIASGGASAEAPEHTIAAFEAAFAFPYQMQFLFAPPAFDFGFSF